MYLILPYSLSCDSLSAFLVVDCSLQFSLLVGESLLDRIKDCVIVRHFNSKTLLRIVTVITHYHGF